MNKALAKEPMTAEAAEEDQKPQLALVEDRESDNSINSSKLRTLSAKNQTWVGIDF